MVYTTHQQRIRYLVEFSLHGDDATGDDVQLEEREVKGDDEEEGTEDSERKEGRTSLSLLQVNVKFS